MSTYVEDVVDVVIVVVVVDEKEANDDAGKREANLETLIPK